MFFFIWFQLYKSLVEPPFSDDEYGRYLMFSKKKYENAIKTFPRYVFFCVHCRCYNGLDKS